MPNDLWSDLVTHVALSTWITDGVLLGISVLLLVLTFLPVGQRFLMAHASKMVGLAVPESLALAVRIAQLRRIRGCAIGGFLGTVVSTYFVYFVGADRGGPATLFLLGGFAIGAVLGAAVAAIAGETSRPAVGIRVAHGTRRSLSDYVPLRERLAARVVVFCSAILLVTELLPAFQWISVAALVTVPAIIALMAFEIGGRLIVRRNQSTASEIELAWDDALRASAIRDLLAAAFLLGAFGTFIGIEEIASWVLISHPIASLVTMSVFYGFTLAMLVVVIVASLKKQSRSYYLGRLHPGLTTSITK